ncbi:elongation factor Ts [Candidatus Uhrbacteria bacterium]|nr:elongation factor Ts [Candidatus Uhrbacteria bacterium]
MIDTSLITQLRSATGAGIVDCKEALTESANNLEKAIEILRKKGQSSMAKRMGRVAREGVVTSYIHGAKIGVLLELLCETDFVARTEDFQNLAKDLSMHIAASAPVYVKAEDIPTTVIEKEKEIYREQLKAEGKPENMFEKIMEGKLKRFAEEQCLIEQVYYRDETKKVKDVIAEVIAKTGEKIEVGRFVRFVLGST